MAAGLGFKEFTTGDVLTAADANGYLASQVVMVFADSAARTTAITLPQEGMISYLKDTNAVEKYDGASWVAVAGGTSPLTTKGDLYTFSTTDARLAVGANGTTLVADSVEATGLKWVTPASAGLTLITSAAFSASGGVNVNDVFSATYTNYKLIVNFTSADSNRDVKLRLRVSATDATGSNYSYGSMGMRSDGVSTFNTSANNTTSFDFCRANSGNKMSASFELFRPFEASPTQMLGRYAGDDNTTPFFNDLGGLHTLSTSYTGFTIFPTAGNITGDYFIYGYKE